MNDQKENITAVVVDDHVIPKEMENEMLIENVKKILDKGEKGNIKNSLANCMTIFQMDPVLKGGIACNDLTQKIDIVKPLAWNRKEEGETINDNDLFNLHLYFEKHYGIRGTKNVEEALAMTAHENSYHPIRDLLESLEWDGKERVRYALHHFLGANTSDYTYELLKLFMLGAIERIYHPGIKFDYILCLVGSQGSGKSSFFRLLAIRNEWFSDDLKDLESEKVYQKLQGHWIIELSEMLATNNARSNEAVKSFLSRQKETYRTPYEKYPRDRPRQCVFAGTTNKITFLPNDRTGNRRFLPVRCFEKDAEVFILDDEEASREYILQMWAEIMVVYRKGNISLTVPSELQKELELQQKKFMKEDVDAGLILSYMESYPGDRVCSKQLYKEALGYENANPQRWQTNEICDIMNQLIAEGTLKGWESFDSPKRFPEYGTQRGWERTTRVPLSEDSFMHLADFEEMDETGVPFISW